MSTLVDRDSCVHKNYHTEQILVSTKERNVLLQCQEGLIAWRRVYFIIYSGIINSHY